MGGSDAGRLGRWGEALIAIHLRERGWKILEWGFRCRMGEIDLIAADGKYLAFVEVKLRRGDRFGTAGEAVNDAKRRRLRTAARYYLTTHPTALQPRFDVAEVYAPRGTATVRPRINYVENAF